MPQPLPNLHHLELFYHVARAGGITAAVRSMPYGIQQPAVSGQIGQLEAELGVRLFQRRPFKLTPAGEELYAFCAPFFGGLADVAASITGTAAKHLRIAAPTTVIREHLPAVLDCVRKRQPDLELTLIETGQKQSLALLEREEVDLVVTDLEGRPPSGTRSEVMLTLPLVLLLPPGMKAPKGGIKDLTEEAPLIRPSAEAAITKLFEKGLTKKRLHWPSRIEVESFDLITAYVARGFGVGLSLKVPGLKFPKEVTEMALPGFPELKIAGLWRGKPGQLAEEVLDGLRKQAKAMR